MPRGRGGLCTVVKSLASCCVGFHSHCVVFAKRQHNDNHRKVTCSRHHLLVEEVDLPFSKHVQ